MLNKCLQEEVNVTLNYNFFKTLETSQPGTKSDCRNHWNINDNKEEKMDGVGESHLLDLLIKWAKQLENLGCLSENCNCSWWFLCKNITVTLNAFRCLFHDKESKTN